MTHPDVLVVGGGVIGAACARALSHQGTKVLLVDSGSQRGAASLIAAGMLAPLAEAAAQDPLLGLAVRARDLYVELAPTLLEETGVDIGIWNEGILQVAFTEEEVAKTKSEVAWQRQSGFTSEWLSPDEVREQAPGISEEVLGAAYAPEDGSVDAVALLDAMIKSAEAKGTEVVRDKTVQDVLIADGHVEGVKTSTGTLHAGAVVIAAGAWAGTIGGMPRPLTVEPIRGQIAALDWPVEEPRAIVYGAGGYVLAHGPVLLAGSTMEHAGFDASVTEEGLARIQRAATRIYPSLEGGEVKHSWAGLRPMTPDGMPIVGPDPRVEGLWYATGHGRNGILLAGCTGELLAQLHAGQTVDYDLSPITPARFWNW
jgi:glycine oxidase